MKKIILLISIICFTSCMSDLTSVYNYPGSVVLKKATSSTGTELTIRRKSAKRHQMYQIETIRVMPAEAINLNVGDTIKISK